MSNPGNNSAKVAADQYAETIASAGATGGRSFTVESTSPVHAQFAFRPAPLATVTHTHDKAGRLSSLSDWASPARTTGYGYVADGQLIRDANADGTVAPPGRMRLRLATPSTPPWIGFGAGAGSALTSRLSPTLA